MRVVLKLHLVKKDFNAALDFLNVPTPSIVDSTCLRVSQLDAFWYLSARAYRWLFAFA